LELSPSMFACSCDPHELLIQENYELGLARFVNPSFGENSMKHNSQGRFVTISEAQPTLWLCAIHLDSESGNRGLENFRNSVFLISGRFVKKWGCRLSLPCVDRTCPVVSLSFRFWASTFIRIWVFQI